MNWGQLLEFILNQDDDFLDEKTQIYDKEHGEYYPADLIQFDESDFIVPNGKVFLTIGE